MNKEKAITVINNHKEHWERLLREEICDKTEGKETIESFDMAISVLSAEGEYIKKEDAIRHFQSFEKIMKSMPLADVKARLKDLPTYSIPNSAENKGEWIKTKDQYGNYHFTCSKCGNDIATKSDVWDDNFCPNCGADMREPKGEKGE